MGNVQMEADQIRYKDSSGTYRNVQTGLAAAIAGGGGGSSTLAGLTDTSITTPSDGQVLTYDSTAEKWENAAIPAQTIDGLSDTTITTPSDGQVLTYDSTAEKWENAAIPAQSINGLSDTTITTPADGQVLTYDSTAEKWVNASGGSGGGGEVYPATETKIGTWGSEDLYRTCKTGTITGAAPNLSTTISSDYTIRRVSAVLYNQSTNILYVLPYYDSAAMSKYNLKLTKSGGFYLINIETGIATGTTCDVNVIIDYTKPATP